MSLYSSPSHPGKNTKSPLPAYLYVTAIYLAVVVLIEVGTELYFDSQSSFKYFDSGEAIRIAIYLALCGLLLMRPLLQLAYSLIPHLLLGVVFVALLLGGTLEEGIPNTSLAAGYYSYPDAIQYIEAPHLLPSLLYTERDSITPKQRHSLDVANNAAGTLALLVLCALLIRVRRNGAQAAGTRSPS